MNAAAMSPTTASGFNAPAAKIGPGFLNLLAQTANPAVGRMHTKPPRAAAVACPIETTDNARAAPSAATSCAITIRYARPIPSARLDRRTRFTNASTLQPATFLALVFLRIPALLSTNNPNASDEQAGKRGSERNPRPLAAPFPCANGTSHAENESKRAESGADYTHAIRRIQRELRGTSNSRQRCVIIMEPLINSVVGASDLIKSIAYE